jgi:branched-chain amino acid transport system permease protein
MTPVSKSLASKLLIAALWLFVLVWPMTGISPEGLDVTKAVRLVGGAMLAVLLCLGAWKLNRTVNLGIGRAMGSAFAGLSRLPNWLLMSVGFAALLAFPLLSSRYGQDVAINVLVYVTLGLGLNIVVGLAGLLDLGYIAFYGVGAYTYALFSVHFQMPFWVALPLCAASRPRPGASSATPRCACAGTIWPSSPLGSEKSYASS